MRAKVRLNQVNDTGGSKTLFFVCVEDTLTKPADRYYLGSPGGQFQLNVDNLDLIKKYVVGQMFWVDITPV